VTLSQQPKVTYKLILLPLGNTSVDVTSRLKRLLKFALRSCGLKCLRIERVEGAGGETATVKKGMRAPG